MTQTAVPCQPGFDLGPKSGLLKVGPNSITHDGFDQLLMQLSEAHHCEVLALRARLPEAASGAPDPLSGRRFMSPRAASERCEPPSGEVMALDVWPMAVDVAKEVAAEVDLDPRSRGVAALPAKSKSTTGAQVPDKQIPALNPEAAAKPTNCIHLPQASPAESLVFPSSKSQDSRTSSESRVTVGEVDVLRVAAEEDALSEGKLQSPFFAQKLDKEFSSIFAAGECEAQFFEVPVYNVENLYHKTGWSQAIARSEYFHSGILSIIALNALTIGLESEHSRASTDTDGDGPFVVFNNFFCVVFGLELLVRLFAFQRKRDCLSDAWFRFDSLLVVLAVVETWLVPLIGSNVDLPFAPFRLLRLLRLTRMVRLMQFVPELVTLTRGVAKASRATFSSLLMIVLMIYLFAILLRFLLDGEDSPTIPFAPNRDFSTLPRCMWTLFVDLAMMDSPAALLTSFFFHGTFKSAVAGIILFIFMVLSAMMIFNMLIGCMCEVVTAVARNERDEFAVNKLKETILCHLIEYDNGDGVISHDELALVMTDPRSIRALQSLNIDKLFLLELQSMLYHREGAKIPIKAIMELMFMCRGDLPTTVKHTAAAQAFLSTLIANFEKRITEQFEALHDAVGCALIHLETLNDSAEPPFAAIRSSA